MIVAIGQTHSIYLCDNAMTAFIFNYVESHYKKSH